MEEEQPDGRHVDPNKMMNLDADPAAAEGEDTSPTQSACESRITMCEYHWREAHSVAISSVTASCCASDCVELKPGIASCRAPMTTPLCQEGTFYPYSRAVCLEQSGR